MTRRLVILPDVKRDLRVAMQWYEAEAEGLALRFLDAANRQFDFICAQPEIYAIVYRSARLSPVDPYPYIIVYTVEPERLTILAVVHTSRDQSVWQIRVP